MSVMDDPPSSRLRPRGGRPQSQIPAVGSFSLTNDESSTTTATYTTTANSTPQETRSSRGLPTSVETLDSLSSSRPTRSAVSSTSGSSVETRSARRAHPYQRQTRSSTQLSQPPSTDVLHLAPAAVAEQDVTPPPSSPSTTSRRAARRNLDAASQQRLFLRRNLISSPRIGGEEIAAATEPPPASVNIGDSTTTRRNRNSGGGSGGRGRGSGGGNTARNNGDSNGGGRIDSLRDRFQSTEARSRSSSASSIIRARLTARISFGQRLALSSSSTAVSVAGDGSPALINNGNNGSNNAPANNGVQTGTDRMTRNGARRAAEAGVDPRVNGMSGLVNIEGVAGVVGHPESGVVNGGPGSNRDDRMGVLSGPGWSGTLDRTHGDEITVQIIDFGRIMGIPPYEIQLLNNLQGQFQDMLHRSFHHSITSRNFEEIPQRVVVEEDLRPGSEPGKKAESRTNSSSPSSSPSSWSETNATSLGSSTMNNTTDDVSQTVDSSSPSSAATSSESRNCTICLMTPVVNDVLKTLPCEHFFHSDCLKQWFTDHASCPMCRDCALCRISGAFNVQFSPS